MTGVVLALTLNGRARTFEIAPNLVLADLLRESCRLPGCKVGCDQAACGACTVLVDGRPVAACTTFAFAVDGCDVVTVEGLGSDTGLSPVQEAFLDAQAFQCGFCTSGMIVSVTALLAAHPDPDEETLDDWLGANICRCTGYVSIVRAVRDAARRMA